MRKSEEFCSDNLYGVSIKEDTAYLCLHFTRNHKELKSNTSYPEDSIRRIQDRVLKDSGSIEHGPYSKKPPIRRMTALLSSDYQLACIIVTKSSIAFLVVVTKSIEPTRYAQVVKEKKWCDAMKKEIDALESNGMWELMTLQPRKKTIGCKWVYKTKYNNDGTVERHKAHLVIYENRQQKGVDYK
ncbi:retrovirus-related pol polyprotein from transposon TNT 1-94 [Tanacetum coccineum]